MLPNSFGKVSLPSENKWSLILLHFFETSLHILIIWFAWECTPPLLYKPIMWTDLWSLCFLKNDLNSSIWETLLSVNALSILGNDCNITLPEPIFICPTSELPIWFEGSPTYSPEASNLHDG